MWVITIQHPLTTMVGLLGNFLSGMVVLSPVPTFYTICKKKSTGSFDSVPYVVGLFSAMMWVYYGLLTGDVLLLSINISVCLIELVYLTIYLIYSPIRLRKYTAKLILLVNVGIFGCLVLFTNLFIKGKRKTEIQGGICASFAISVFAAPLSIIRLVIRTKSVEYMPFSMSFFLTISAVAWFGYGVLRGDMFVALPNVVGFLLGITQIIVYLIYMKYDKEGTTNPKLNRNNSNINDNNAHDIEATGGDGDIEIPEKQTGTTAANNNKPRGETCSCGQTQVANQV